MIAPAPLMANLVAESISGRDYISFSALSTYRQCPLRYAFRYVEQLPEESVSASLVFGRAIHAALELHFHELMAGAPLPDHETLLLAFGDAWRDLAESTPIVFGKGEDVSTLWQMADRVLTAFRNSDWTTPAGRLLGVEEELRGSLIAGVPELLARIDLLLETETELVIRDFKTSRTRWAAGQAENQAEQLLLYSELVRQLAPGKPIRLEFAVISKSKTPSLDVYRVPCDPHRIDRIKRIVRAVWSAIETGLYYPVPSAMNCPGCPFRKPCGAWRG